MGTNTFAVGDVVKSEGLFGSGITLEVVELLENKNLRVKLAEVDYFWSDRGFVADQEYILEWKEFLGRDSWSFQPPASQPFLLTIRDGKKVFML